MGVQVNAVSIREEIGLAPRPNNYTIYVCGRAPNNIPKREALTLFSHSNVRPRPEMVDGHYIIEHSMLVGSLSDGLPAFHVEPVGVAHTAEEIPEKTYECVVRVGKSMAAELGYEFNDLTKRAKEGTREVASATL